MERNNIVAVYGTLRKGQGNHRRLEHGNAKFLGKCKIGNFGMVSLGGFPAVYSTEEPDKLITIEVYEVDDATMRSLDQLEGFPNFYNRKQVPTPLGTAWIYFIDSYATRDTPRVPDGDWVNFNSMPV